MPSALTDPIDRFSEMKVLVIGDAILDSHLDGVATRISREAPVPIVEVKERRDATGGAANTAANARGLGASVELIAVVGDDDDGRSLQASLERASISTAYVLPENGRRTTVKTRLLADGQIVARYDQGSTEPPLPQTEQKVLKQAVVLAIRTGDPWIARRFALADRVVAEEALVRPAHSHAQARPH